ncbi:hypothetical protein A2U01_0074033, partial [Trifolium medium]|nr:hypothetical protein [Trifolium medium]
AVAIPQNRHNHEFAPQAKFLEATWHQTSAIRPRRDFPRLR